MAEIQSRPFKPDAEMCCEACVFGRGEHAEFCTNPEVLYARTIDEQMAKVRRYVNFATREFDDRCR